jgi:hypothetical protein
MRVDSYEGDAKSVRKTAFRVFPEAKKTTFRKTPISSSMSKT